MRLLMWIGVERRSYHQRERNSQAGLGAQWARTRAATNVLQVYMDQSDYVGRIKAGLGHAILMNDEAV